MAYDPRALGALCDQCPCNGQQPVPPKFSLNPKLVVLGETPGDTEVERQEPFVGETGQFLNRILEFLGINRDDLHITNTAKCKPSFSANKKDYRTAMECCRPLLVNELKSLEGQVRTVLAFGNLSTTVTLGGARAVDWFGPPVPMKLFELIGDGKRPKKRPLTFNVVTSYHPSFAFTNRSPQYGGVIANMTRRAWEDAHDNLRPWEWGRIVTDVDGDTAIVEAVEAIRRSGRGGCDVENAMVHNAHEEEEKNKRLYNVGFGRRALGLAVSVTWYKASGHVKRAFMEALADPSFVKVMQGGDHDARVFHSNQLPLAGYHVDTLVMHWLTHPRQVHKLDYSAALAFDTAPRWKDIFRGDRTGDYFAEAEETARAIYNAQDCIIQDALADENEKQLAHVHNGQSIYQSMMTAWNIGIDMWKWGVKIDVERLGGLRIPIREKYEEHASAAGRLAESVGFKDVRSKGDNGTVSVPFSVHNPGQIRRLFEDILHVKSHRKTDTGAGSYDEEALEGLKDAGGVAGDLAREILGAREWHKRLQYVKDPPIWSDGCVRPKWQPCKAATLRWTCPGFPVQTIPKRSKEGKKLREMFVPEEGLWMVIADFHQQECRLEALYSGEPVLMEAFSKGVNPYSAIAAELFGGRAIDHSKGTASYNCAKIAFLALIYGVGDEKLLEQMRDNGAAKIDILKVMAVRARFFLKMPKIREYMSRVEKEAFKNDYVEELQSGYRYHYFGQVTATHSWNFINQAGGAFLLNQAIQKVRKELGEDEAIRLVVHDEIVLTGPDAKRLVKILQDCMPANLEYNDRQMHFPIELSAASDKESWGTARPWEIVEKEL